MIYYFSGTGNSKYIAVKLSEDLNIDNKNIADFLDNINSVSNKNDFDKMLNTESIGIVFPTYYFGPPMMIKEFLNELSTLYRLNNINLKDKYIYIIYTYEAYSAGLELKLKKIFNNIDLSFNYIKGIKMPNNFSIYYDIQSEELRDKILDEADILVKSVAEDIRDRKQNNVKANIFDQIISNILYPVYKNGRKTKRFNVDDKCISCGLCERVCPSKAIELESGKPIWVKKQCEFCLACYNRCPVNSIQIGNWTKNRKRYFNPRLKEDI